jgi:hypothetical protein
LTPTEVAKNFLLLLKNTLHIKGGFQKAVYLKTLTLEEGHPKLHHYLKESKSNRVIKIFTFLVCFWFVGNPSRFFYFFALFFGIQIDQQDIYQSNKKPFQSA